MYKRGLVFGALDPLHFGHIRLFRRAKEVCREVYACTESDEIIRKAKGREPFTTEMERMQDLEGIKYLSGVFIRTEERNRDYIVGIIEPDVLILGSDYIDKEWEGRKLGIEIIYFPYTHAISSTFLRDTMREPIINGIIPILEY